jgi:hypothetical protein
VAEYLSRFTYLSRQAPEEANTNGRKQYHFLNGLHNQIQVQLLNSDYTSFQKLVDKAIIIEAKQAEIERDRKRKLHLKGQQSNANTRLHLMQPQNPFYHCPNTIRPPMPPHRHQFQMQRPNSQFQRWAEFSATTSKQPGVSPQPSGTPSSCASSSWCTAELCSPISSWRPAPWSVLQL